ncbi:transglutaminase-like cysteine peptidase [uncultured Cohaesibacter sp.]|uniref:transglutaminase-like cysteine peptidase n=1 Tax=uncultured Cohaesibacter sp. TaxID=1002546 RepID=UPI00292E6826|nr:transglutaminase-like cysteine peptidase [uncultured Cohaesibacter sp.]
MTRRLHGAPFVKRPLLASGVVLSIVIGFSPVQAFAAQSWTMRVTERTSPPAGHVYFCASNPALCNRYGHGAIRLTQESWQQLLDINSQVNASIKAKADGRIDEWSIYVAQGDCEDYALTKQQELLRKGWPSDALLITTAFLKDGTYHAILLVRTDRGEFVLDNLSPLVLPWQKVSYQWNKRQSVGNPRIWQRVAGAPKASGSRPVAGLELRGRQ